MKLFRTALMAAGVMLAGAAATTASATTEIYVTNVGTVDPNLGLVTTGGFGAVWTTPILMTIKNGPTLTVFCDDLYHVVYVTGGQNLPYHIGAVDTDSNGNPISQPISNEMGQLADIGRLAVTNGDEAGGIAAQAAIWDLEYGVTSTVDVSSTLGQQIQTDLTADLLIKPDNNNYAFGLIADAGQQSQVIGVIPEPATWAMMLMGFGGLGAAMRGARRRQPAAATA